jgi:hypothetical protein
MKSACERTDRDRLHFINARKVNSINHRAGKLAEVNISFSKVATIRALSSRMLLQSLTYAIHLQGTNEPAGAHEGVDFNHIREKLFTIMPGCTMRKKTFSTAGNFQLCMRCHITISTNVI